ncbi:MAG: RNA-binding S4 domain-containing protein [Clostridia bacterium]|nr:RNA-binding S4 domain-containing protein [Clostridia bacterium]
MKIKNVKAKVLIKEPEILNISGDIIPLDSALKFSGIVSTGGQAKIIIQAGEVKVNGEVCDKRTKKLRNGDKFEFENKLYEVCTHEGKLA